MFGKSLDANTPNPSIVFDQTPVPVEDIVYEHLRCNLVHEAMPAPQIAFSESKIVDGKVQANLVVESPNMIHDFWVLHLIKAVREAPENAAEFSGPWGRLGSDITPQPMSDPKPMFRAHSKDDNLRHLSIAF